MKIIFLCIETNEDYKAIRICKISYVCNDLDKNVDVK